MPRSIQRRRALSQNRQQWARESQVVPEAVEQDRFETIVPFYHQRVLEGLDAETAASLDSDDLTDVVLQLLRQLETAADAPSIGGVHQALAQRIVDEMRGLGPLGPLLRDPDISDILVNGMHSVYIEKHGVLSRIDVRFRDFDHITRLAQRIAEGVGRRVDELSPMCDARLEDGSRVNIIVPPLAIDGAAISIRRFRQGGFSLADLARGGAMHPGMVTMLELAARAKLNVVVSGGTADQRVAEEAVVTAGVMGNRVERLYDVGVAGLHRLLSERTRLEEARVIVVVAGMEGALASVVGGLVAAPVVAVPTSVGYGAGAGGIAALLSMLNSCAPGVAVVNIDNGFGAAALASLINHL